MWLFNRRVMAVPTPGQWPLDMALGEFSRQDVWRLSDAVTGTLVLGSTGSGKSSGPARYLLTRMLRAGLGGLVLTVKTDDRIDIERYAAACGRQDDLVIFAPDQVAHRCNLLAYELSHGGGSPASRLENAVALFQTALEIAEKDHHANASSGENKYFERAALQMLRSGLSVLILAGEEVSVANLHNFIMAAPQTLEESESNAWRGESYCYRTLCRADDRAMSPSETKDFELSLTYWMREYASMDVKPRSSIISTVTTMLDLFQRGFIRDMFFSETTITPEACREGKIIVLDIPTLRWNDVGRIPQALFKFVWQRSQERCDAAAKARPVFLYSDEAQQFLTQFDAPFQATARSSRVCTLYITQNLSGMYDAVGGEAGRYSIDALLGNLRLKIFCAQDDISATATWQSELIGKTKKLFFNSSTQSAPDQSFDFFRPGKHRSAGMSESLEYTIQPWEWSSKFRTGGVEYQFQVDAIAYQGGRNWKATGKTYLPITFNQREEC